MAQLDRQSGGQSDSMTNFMEPRIGSVEHAQYFVFRRRAGQAQSYIPVQRFDSETVELSVNKAQSL